MRVEKTDQPTEILALSSLESLGMTQERPVILVYQSTSDHQMIVTSPATAARDFQGKK